MSLLRIFLRINETLYVTKNPEDEKFKFINTNQNVSLSQKNKITCYHEAMTEG